MFQRVNEQVMRPPLVRFTDGLIAAIETDLASVPPERGGAILGFGETGHLLLSDTFGTYGPASWLISSELSTAIGRMEARGHGTLLGTVHSHPAGVLDPSGPDVSTTAHALAMNPHLDQLIIAVVTAGAPREFDVPLGSLYRMSVHVLRRQAGSHPSLLRARVAIHPITRCLAAAGLVSTSLVSVNDALASDLNGVQPPMVLRGGGRETLLVPAPDTPGSAVLVDPLFPTVSPIAVRTDMDSAGPSIVPLPSPWDPTKEPDQQLVSLVRLLKTSQDGQEWARIKELTGSLADKRAVVVGAGSVGSRIAEDLTRSGVQTLTLVDPDVVTTPNLARSVYTQADVGTAKVDALRARMLAINPAMAVTVHRAPICDLEPADLLAGADLAVLATDDMNEQAYLAHWAYHLQIPHIAAAMYRKGAAGEVVLVVPAARTPCWNCCVGANTRSGGQRPDADYGLQGRLVAESALGPSINIVTSVASQMAIGTLAGPDSHSGAPLARLLAGNRTLGLISTTPEWDFFPQVFDGMAHQHQPQSVWLSVQPNPECPVCGAEQRAPLSRQEGERFIEGLLRLQAAEIDAATSSHVAGLGVDVLHDPELDARSCTDRARGRPSTETDELAADDHPSDPGRTGSLA